MDKLTRSIFNTLFKPAAFAGLLLVGLSGCGEDENYFAKVNDRGLKEADFNAYLKHKRIQFRNDIQREKVLDQYLEREALADLIENDLMKDDALIGAEINELRKEILISRYFERYLGKQVTDDAVSNFYNSNIERYQEQKIHVAHILIRLARNMDESQRQVQLTTAQEAYSKVQAGMPFDEAASQYSEDKVSAAKGGDLGWLVQGSIHPKFSEQAFKLKQGEISAPIETPFGYHVVKVLDEPKINRKSFESVKGEIRYELRNKARDAERKRILGAIRIEKIASKKTN